MMTGSSAIAIKPQERQAHLKDAQHVREARMKRLLFLLCILFSLVASFNTSFIPSKSMEPTLAPGDHILTMRAWLAYPFGRTPARGDTILFRLPENKLEDDADTAQDTSTAEASTPGPAQRALDALKRLRSNILIKRVVALPGETIWIHNNAVYVNGHKLIENYDTIPVKYPWGVYYNYAVEEPYKVPADCVFVLGDNRNNSEDSRFWGPVKRKWLVGKCMGVIYHEGKSLLATHTDAHEMDDEDTEE